MPGDVNSLTVRTIKVLAPFITPCPKRENIAGATVFRAAVRETKAMKPVSQSCAVRTSGLFGGPNVL